MSEENANSSSAENDGAANKNDPASSSTGQSSQSNSTSSPLTSSLPEKLKGKSVNEIADMYVNLEKTMGESSKEVSEVRKMKKDMEVVLQAIYQDPEVYRKVERRIKEMQNGGSLSEEGETSKGNGEATNSDQGNKVDDVRLSQQNIVINEFEKKFKLNDLSAEKRQEINRKIATELSEMVDPGGKKPLNQVLNSVRLDQLPKILEKAYWLAHKDSLLDHGSSAQDLASIGSMSSSNGKSDNKHGLTEREVQIAQKLGVSPEKYAANKKKSE
jgi:hypothetical protein